MPKQRHNDRRCVGTGEPLPPGALAIRFVKDPAGKIVPDLAEKLPGRGVWLSANREALEQAIKKGAFSKALRSAVELPTNKLDEFADQLSGQLLARAVEWLGLCRKAGELISGADTLRRKAADVIAYVHPASVAPDSVRKICARLEDQAKANHIELTVDTETFGSALGDLGVVHVGLLRGHVSSKTLWELSRWRAFSVAESDKLH